MNAFRSGMLLLALGAVGSSLPAAAQSPAAPPAEQKEKPTAQQSANATLTLPSLPVTHLPQSSGASPPTNGGTNPAPQAAPLSAPGTTAPSSADSSPAPSALPDASAPGPIASSPGIASATSKIAKRGGLNFYSPEREQELGKQLDTQMLSQVQLLDDPVVTAYLEEVTAHIARNSDVHVPVVIRVVASSGPDSFSLPGGYVYITVGMVQETRTEAELAAILSHEVAHIACRHATRQMTRRELMSLLSIPLMFVSGPIGMAVGEGFTLAYPLTILKFSRNAESEADAVGLSYMQASGYDPAAAISLFERVASQDSTRMPGLRRLLSTHPMGKDRLAAASRVMEKLPPQDEYVVSTSRYDEAVARLSRIGFKHDPGIPALIRRTTPGDTQP